MIRSLVIIHNGQAVVEEHFTSRADNDRELRLAKTLDEYPALTKKPSIADLNQVRAHYLSYDGTSVVIVCDQMDDLENANDILDQIWRKTLHHIQNEEYDKAGIVAVNEIITQQIKISIFGQYTVGKTTITNLLLGKPIPLRHVPTIGVKVFRAQEDVFGDIGAVNVWDTAGQRKFATLWPLYVRNSQLILLVTDSRLESVLWSKKMIPQLRNWAPRAGILGVANKQDRPNGLLAERVQSILGVDTFGLVAIDCFSDKSRNRLRNMIRSALGFDPQCIDGAEAECVPT
jgi:small GTP-binding protein